MTVTSVGKSDNMDTLVVEDVSVQELKWKFAEACLRNPNNPFKAAMHITFGDSTAALSILNEWHHSIEINRMKQHLVETLGEEEFLPSKSQIVQQVLTRADRAADDSDYCKLMTLAVDVMGMSSKASNTTNITVNSQTNNKIMQIPTMVNPQGIEMSDDEFEQSCIQQQERLTTGMVES